MVVCKCGHCYWDGAVCENRDGDNNSTDLNVCVYIGDNELF